MSVALSPRMRGLLALGGGGLVAGLASGHAELAVLGTPFLVFVGLGLAQFGEFSFVLAQSCPLGGNLYDVWLQG